jgi:hypothetical protein
VRQLFLYLTTRYAHPITKLLFFPTRNLEKIVAECR